MRFQLPALPSIIRFAPMIVLIVLVAALILWPRSKDDQTASGDWTCSMHPQVRLPNRGSCPICGMDLIPVSQLKSLEDRAGIETEVITRRELFKEIRTVGKLDYNETRVAHITARIDGRVDRLYVDFTGIDVEDNDHLVDIYSPSLIVAQEELLRASDALERQRIGGTGVTDQFLRGNLDSARDKLRLWGILPEQIAEFERTREPRDHVTLFAPIAGTVIEKNIRVGQYVKEGDLLYRIADLDPLWLYLDAYEYDIAWVRYGQSVDVELEAIPGATIQGMVTFIDPFLNENTRTVKVRVNLPNPDRRLKPGMYASASIRVRLNADGTAAPTGLEGKFACPMHPEIIQDVAGKCSICQMDLKKIPERGPFAHVGQPQDDHDHGKPAEDGVAHEETQPSDAPELPTQTIEEIVEKPTLPLAIRASAVLDTGRRRITYRKRDDGSFELVTLTVGARATAEDEKGRPSVYFPVLDGLRENDEVVVRAGFLLDSQRQIEGMPSLFFPEGAAPASGHAGHSDHAGNSGGPKVDQRGPSDMEKMRLVLQKLSPEDRASAERQHICPVTGKMLGTMGPPEKVEVNGREVWICCSGCRDELLNHPDKYLSKLPAP